MSTGPLPKQVNYRKLAQETGKLEGFIRLDQCERLAGSILETSGEVQVKLSFRKARKHRFLVVGKTDVVVRLECQNCLTPLEFQLQVDVRYFIVNDADVEIPEGEDSLVCEGEMIRPVDIIEDELILGLPMVSRHSDGDCPESHIHINENSPVEGATHKPFAALAELKDKFKRS